MLNRISLPTEVKDEPFIAFEIITDDFPPFQKGWVVLADKEALPYARPGTLCAAFIPGQGHILGKAINTNAGSHLQSNGARTHQLGNGAKVWVVRHIRLVTPEGARRSVPVAA